MNADSNNITVYKWMYNLTSQSLVTIIEETNKLQVNKILLSQWTYLIRLWNHLQTQRRGTKQWVMLS